MIFQVQDDVVECTTEVEEKCEDETSGYTTNTKCSKWPREVCSVSKKNVKKYTPITGCTKEPRELCAPAGSGFSQVGFLSKVSWFAFIKFEQSIQCIINQHIRV